MEEFDWLSSNTKTAFPFTTRQDDLSHELFVDLSVYASNLRDKPQLVRLSRFDPTPGNERVTLTFSDAIELLDMTPDDSSFRKTVFGAYTIFEWSRSRVNTATLITTVFEPAGAGFTLDDHSVKLVVFTAALTDFSYPLAPSPGYIVPSLLNAMARGVRRLMVRLPDLLIPSQIRFFEVLTNKVIFKPGLNTTLTLTQPDISTASLPRAKKTITVDVVPGTGQGFFVNCDPTQHPGIRTVNKVPPNALGNLALVGQDCIWVETLVAALISTHPQYPNTDYTGALKNGTLGLHNSCGACCDCSDYQQAYEAIRSSFSSAKTVAARVETMRKSYNQLVPIIADIASGPGVKGHYGQVLLQAVPAANYAVGLTATFQNDSNKWLQGNTFEITMKGMPGFKPNIGTGEWLISDQPGNPVKVDPVSTDVYTSPTEASSQMQLSLPWVKPGARYSFRFSGRFSSVTGFPRQNNALGAQFKFTNSGGGYGDPNNPNGVRDPVQENIQVETPISLIGPPPMT